MGLSTNPSREPGAEWSFLFPASGAALPRLATNPPYPSRDLRPAGDKFEKHAEQFVQKPCLPGSGRPALHLVRQELLPLNAGSAKWRQAAEGAQTVFRSTYRLGVGYISRFHGLVPQYGQQSWNHCCFPCSHDDSSHLINPARHRNLTCFYQKNGYCAAFLCRPRRANWGLSLTPRPLGFV